jgi:hypothetical protein
MTTGVAKHGSVGNLRNERWKPIQWQQGRSNTVSGKQIILNANYNNKVNDKDVKKWII